jgi:probable rRNA maturation factor
MDSYRKTLTDLAGRILDDSGRSEAELSILITDDEEICSLNRIYRAIDRPTDVLSFSQIEGEGPVTAPQLLGDVVISWETAQRQASELGHSVLVEIKRLLVHGVLHLLGFDHEEGDEAGRTMREEEEKYRDEANWKEPGAGSRKK